jgi:hypothetical protein
VGLSCRVAVLGELLALAALALRALLGQETKVTKTGVLELAVRHLDQREGKGRGRRGQ